MATVKFESGGEEPDAFNLYDDDQKIGEMIVGLNGQNLTVYHTEVDEDQAGKGYAGLLLENMVAYVRANGWKVVPLCPYVAAQFKRHPDQYQDIWNQEIKPSL